MAVVVWVGLLCLRKLLLQQQRLSRLFCMIHVRLLIL